MWKQVSANQKFFDICLHRVAGTRSEVRKPRNVHANLWVSFDATHESEVYSLRSLFDISSWSREGDIQFEKKSALKLSDSQADFCVQLGDVGC